MPRSGGAVIPMQLSFKELQYIVGSEETAAGMPAVRPLKPFDDNAVSFLNSLSAVLMKNRAYPDISTFGFWCRRSALLQEKTKYDDINERLGKGIVFHSTPSNVPVNFAFSFASGLLAGNANIVRLPGKPFEQVDIICDAVKELLADKYKDIAPYVCFVKFPPVKEIADVFSSMCNVRVIWGGDMTVAELRQSELPARATEITFADRYSFGVIDADAVDRASDEELRKLAEAFYNDTYLMDQNACSAPHLICWKKTSVTNEVMQNTQKRFWDSIYSVAQKYDLADIKASDKYTDLCDKVMRRTVSDVERYDNLLYVCKLSQLPQDVVMSCRGRYGMFFEYEFSDWDELSVLSDTRVQTCAVFGVDPEEVAGFITDNNIQGIDRIVPFGKTLEIDTVWDGYDLIGSMSRVIGY